MSRDIVLATEIHADPKAVYDTIATRSGLAAFWTPDVQGEEAVGGELTFGFSQAPIRLPVRVTRLDAPSAIEWACPAGFPFWEGTTVSWSIEASEHGAKVVFRHLGFDDAMPDYEFGSVAQAWGSIVGKLKSVVENGGMPDPALG